MTKSPVARSRALLVVDVQPTFCEGGELPVDGGNEVAQAIAAFIQAHGQDYEAIVSTQDWHIDPGAHFSDEPDFVDTWPPHGIAGTDNAELHPALDDVDFDEQVRKGAYSAAYSGFEGTTEDGQSLAELLDAWEVDGVDVVGLAESHCVKQTALDARKLGLCTRVFADLTRPVSEELGAAARECMIAKGIKVETSEQLAAAAR